MAVLRANRRFLFFDGDVDQVDPVGKYVVCWFDDSVEDFHAGFRRLSGVHFPYQFEFYCGS